MICIGIFYYWLYKGQTLQRGLIYTPLQKFVLLLFIIDTENGEANTTLKHSTTMKRHCASDYG